MCLNIFKLVMNFQRVRNPLHNIVQVFSYVFHLFVFPLLVPYVERQHRWFKSSPMHHTNNNMVNKLAKYKHTRKMHSTKPTKEELDAIKKLKRGAGHLRRKNEGKR